MSTLTAVNAAIGNKGVTFTAFSTVHLMPSPNLISLILRQNKNKLVCARETRNIHFIFYLQPANHNPKFNLLKHNPTFNLLVLYLFYPVIPFVFMLCFLIIAFTLVRNLRKPYIRISPHSNIGANNI